MPKQTFRVIAEVTFENPPRKVTAEDIDFIIRQEHPKGFSVNPMAIEDITDTEEVPR